MNNIWDVIPWNCQGTKMVKGIRNQNFLFWADKNNATMNRIQGRQEDRNPRGPLPKFQAYPRNNSDGAQMIQKDRWKWERKGCEDIEITRSPEIGKMIFFSVIIRWESETEGISENALPGLKVRKGRGGIESKPAYCSLRQRPSGEGKLCGK